MALQKVLDRVMLSFVFSNQLNSQLQVRMLNTSHHQKTSKLERNKKATLFPTPQKYIFKVKVNLEPGTNSSSFDPTKNLKNTMIILENTEGRFNVVQHPSNLLKQHLLLNQQY